MDTFTEILRRLRFVWAILWLIVAGAMAIYSPALFPLRVVPPLLAAFAPYMGPVPVRLALTWLGVWVTLGLARAIDRGQAATSDSFGFIFIIAPAGAVIIIVLSFLLSPLFKRKGV